MLLYTNERPSRGIMTVLARNKTAESAREGGAFRVAGRLNDGD